MNIDIFIRFESEARVLIKLGFHYAERRMFENTVLRTRPSMKISKLRKTPFIFMSSQQSSSSYILPLAYTSSQLPRLEAAYVNTNHSTPAANHPSCWLRTSAILSDLRPLLELSPATATGIACPLLLQRGI